MLNVHRRTRGSELATIPLAGALVLLLSGVARPDATPPRSGAAHHPPPSAAHPVPGVGRAAVVLDLDPTGTATEASLNAERDPSLARSTDGLVLETRPDGSRHVDLRGRFRSYTAVSVAADGTLRMGCSDDPVAALRLAGVAGGSMASAAGTHRPAFGPEEE